MAALDGPAEDEPPGAIILQARLRAAKEQIARERAEFRAREAALLRLAKRPGGGEAGTAWAGIGAGALTLRGDEYRLREEAALVRLAKRSVDSQAKAAGAGALAFGCDDSVELRAREESALLRFAERAGRAAAGIAAAGADGRAELRAREAALLRLANGSGVAGAGLGQGAPYYDPAQVDSYLSESLRAEGARLYPELQGSVAQRVQRLVTDVMTPEARQREIWALGAAFQSTSMQLDALAGKLIAANVDAERAMRLAHQRGELLEAYVAQSGPLVKSDGAAGRLRSRVDDARVAGAALAAPPTVAVSAAASAPADGGAVKWDPASVRKTSADLQAAQARIHALEHAGAALRAELAAARAKLAAELAREVATVRSMAEELARDEQNLLRAVDALRLERARGDRLAAELGASGSRAAELSRELAETQRRYRTLLRKMAALDARGIHEGPDATDEALGIGGGVFGRLQAHARAYSADHDPHTRSAARALEGALDAREQHSEALRRLRARAQAAEPAAGCGGAPSGGAPGAAAGASRPSSPLPAAFLRPTSASRLHPRARPPRPASAAGALPEPAAAARPERPEEWPPAGPRPPPSARRPEEWEGELERSRELAGALRRDVQRLALEVDLRSAEQMVHATVQLDRIKTAREAAARAQVEQARARGGGLTLLAGHVVGVGAIRDALATAASSLADVPLVPAPAPIRAPPDRPRADAARAAEHDAAQRLADGLRAKQGPPDAQYNLGVSYLGGEGVPKDEREAVRLFRLAANKGNARAQSQLAWSYANRLGVLKDEREAAHLYHLAADKGHAPAQHNLGNCYAKGWGVSQDEREAARLHRLAAEQGLAGAQLQLGILYAQGQGVPHDDREAARLFRLAANEGDAGAQHRLSVCYHDGNGVAKDEREAARLYRLAAEQGYASAQFGLGLLYAQGQDVTRDEREAERLFRLAAEQGDARGQIALGRMLVGDGEGPTQLREGALLLARAAQHGGAATRKMALACLGEHARERDVAHACCIGCGKSKQLKLCGKCRVAKWCGPECAKRMWPLHKACCKLWAGEASAAGAAASASATAADVAATVT